MRNDKNTIYIIPIGTNVLEYGPAWQLVLDGKCRKYNFEICYDTDYNCTISIRTNRFVVFGLPEQTPMIS